MRMNVHSHLCYHESDCFPSYAMVTKRKHPEPARPPKATRDELRRHEIVEAGRRCVLRLGFHASPMAEIAREAGMSVGQVYRYFEGKAAIIRAIVDGIIEARLQHMARGAENPLTAERLATRNPLFDERHREDSVLMLEVTAEATRDPDIAAMVRDADRRSQEEAIRTLLRHYPELDPGDAAARCEIAAVLIEGTLCRRATSLHADPERLHDVYQRLLDVLGLAPAAPR